MKHNLDVLTNRYKHLLDEREQEINLAKIICPDYDPFDEHWKSVKMLSLEISELKKEIIVEHVKEKNCKQKSEWKHHGSKIIRKCSQ